MAKHPFILIGGGVRSGKSRFALALARRLGRRRLFVATAQAGDAEMHARIERHRHERGGDFETAEVPLDLPDALRERAAGYDVVLVDCLTLWLANVLLETGTSAAVETRVTALLDSLSARATPIIIVTNEVGLGIVPESELGRVFRDLAGSAHQRLSRQADEVYFAVLGTMLRIKPTLAPVNLAEFDA
jgi:adenosylcobinamide kinase/adenosylcobinamide-phosphate guanylyltransferase